MFENATVRILRARHHGAPGNIGRDKNGRHTHPKTVKVERCSGSRFICQGTLTVRFTSRGHDVVVDSAVLVIDDQHRGRFPKLLFCADGVVSVGDESFALLHVVIGVLV